MISYMGFKQIPVFYAREPRRHWKSRCPLFGRKVLYNSMIRGVIAFSNAPLLLAFLVAGILMAAALAGFFALLRGWGNGLGTMAVLVFMVLISGILAFLQGIQNLYIMDIRRQCRKHPLYVIARKHGFSNES